MIRQVQLRSFKQFEDQSFALGESVVLAGPNNSGKTTLLQAIGAWRLARDVWRLRRTKGTGKARSVPITRKDFTAVPLREMNQLWTGGQTAIRRSEPHRGKPGHPRFMEIELHGSDAAGQPWSLCFEFRCQSAEQIYVKPQDDALDRLPQGALDLEIVHVPAFSGIGVAETRYDRPYQELLVGQGRAGDILRNLLLDVSSQAPAWDELVAHVETIFGFTLLKPEYEGRPHILCDYLPQVARADSHPGLPELDIASAGSGFHQVLLLLAFLFARPATVLLLDEPDAHQHVVLQKQVHDLLRSIASRRGSQLIVATHSEVLIDGTSPERIVSFYGKPHGLTADVEREQLREATKRLPAIDLLLAESSPGVLYVEGETDFNLLRSWARVLDHPLCKWFDHRPFWHANLGRHPREARGHFFALRAVRRDYRAVLLLDGDNRRLPDREVVGEGLEALRWRRYEAESYLHPASVLRWIQNRWPMFLEPAQRFLADQLPPAALRNPLDDAPFWEAAAVSKTLWPGVFEAAHLPIPKSDYYLIAEQMTPAEVHPEVIEKLDAISKALGL